MEHFNPMFLDISLDRDTQMPTEGTEYHLAHYGHVNTALTGNVPLTELQREGHYRLTHPQRERYGGGMGDENIAVTEESSMEELLKQLPSRQLESAADSAARSLHRQQSRKKSVYETLRQVRAVKQPDEMIEDMIDSADMMDVEEEERMEEAIRSAPTTISAKRSYMRRLSSKKRNAPGKLKRFKYQYGMAWKHFKDHVAELKYSLYLWRGPLKRIEGHFGTGVLSYFVFLKWLLFINIPTVLLTLGFICVPQLLHRWLQQEPAGYINNTDFTGLELLTGAGWFSDTIMYYGFYTTDMIKIVLGNEYRMQVAYLFTSGGYYLLTLIILGHSILRSYKTFYIESSGAYSMYFINKILGSWDYGITSPEAVELKHKSYYQEIKEYLAGVDLSQYNRLTVNRCKLILLRMFTNFLVLGLLVGSGYLVYFLSENQAPDSSATSENNLLLLMVLPLVIGVIHLIIPILFSIIEHYEQYHQPKHELYFHISRSMLLRLSTLGVLVYYWYNKVARSDSVGCWESFVGQEVYRLVIIQLIFTLFGTFFSEFVRRLLSLKFEQKIERAEFAIGRYTLELIYAQTLCWLGTFYAPLLSFIVIIKFIIVFYVKETSALQNCQPSKRPWRAARAHTIFLALLFVSFMFSTIAVAIGIVFVKPSSNCGPYKGKDVMYSIVTELIHDWEQDRPVLTDIIEFISSPGFISSILILFGMGVYYVRVIMIGRKETVHQLQQQLVLEGKDKIFLLNLLNQVSMYGNKLSVNAEQNRPLTREMTSDPDLASRSGRVFVRTVAESAVAAK